MTLLLYGSLVAVSVAVLYFGRDLYKDFRRRANNFKSDSSVLIRQSRAVPLWDVVVGSAQHLLWPRRKGKVV